MKYKGIKDWQKQGIKIVYQTITVNRSTDKLTIEERKQISYLDLLRLNLREQEKEVKECYQSLFSSSKTSEEKSELLERKE